jgi:transketolase
MVSVNYLIEKAAMVRLKVMETAIKVGKGHVPPALSWVEIGVILYYLPVLRLRHDEPTWKQRDRFVLSKGHACLTLYAILADLQYFPESELAKFAGPGSLLPGHPDPLIPGVDVLSGSLGHGLGLAVGMGLSARLSGESWRVFVILGDGECNEGSIWEAALSIAHHSLTNVIVIVDRNRLSATNYTENIVALDPLVEKFRAFGWDSEEVDGHDYSALSSALAEDKLSKLQKPLAIIANTVKGKGVDFMEDSPNWHHQLPKGSDAIAALQQLGSSFKPQ